jgi:hypothetical protein
MGCMLLRHHPACTQLLARSFNITISHQVMPPTARHYWPTKTNKMPPTSKALACCQRIARQKNSAMSLIATAVLAADWRPTHHPVWLHHLIISLTILFQR